MKGLFTFLICISIASVQSTAVVGTLNGTRLERLAAKEARRYVGLLVGATGVPPTLHQLSSVPAAALSESIFIVTVGKDVVTDARLGGWDPEYALASSSFTSSDSHLLHTFPNGAIVCAGATEIATLYAVYALAEELGARFYLDGDVLPAAPKAGKLDALRQPPYFTRTFTARFGQRGLQPYNNFLVGPDLWQLENYKAIATQMTKMKMNVWGFHNYPLREPMVWVGVEEGFDATTGDVHTSASYKTSWASAVSTSTFCCGAAQLFASDVWGNVDVMLPPTPRANVTPAGILNRAAEFERSAFGWARDHAGVSTVIGIQFPLRMPPRLIRANTTKAKVYAGIFARIVAAKIPITKFWLWSAEPMENHGTGRGLPQSNPAWATMAEELHIAKAALVATKGATFTLGTSGWCLGPGDNASFFASILPESTDPTFVVSAINGELGWQNPDAAYAKIQGDRAWSIPWMEDDLSLGSAELWVNRTFEYADRSAEYKTGGLLGLLWRTWETSPQTRALAEAGWASDAGGGGSASSATVALYTEWCAARFGAARGSAPGEACVALFLSVDGFAASHLPERKDGLSKLPRDGQTCCGGPMVAADVADASYLDVTPWQQWLPTIRGAENIARATRWVKLFEYHRQTQIVANLTFWATTMGTENHATNAERFALGSTLVAAYELMLENLLDCTTSSGTFGLIAVHENRNWATTFSAAIATLAGPTFSGSCVVTQTPFKCFQDENGNALEHWAWRSSPNNTLENCAWVCHHTNASWTVGGAEYGGGCACGSRMPDPAKNAPLPSPPTNCAMRCTNASSEYCGGMLEMLVFTYDASSCAAYPGVGCGANCLTPAQIATLAPSTEFRGATRMFPAAVRTVISAEEATVEITVTVLAPGAASTAVTLYINDAVVIYRDDDASRRATAPKAYAMHRATDAATGAVQAASRVYTVRVPTPVDDFSWHVEAVGGGSSGVIARWPLASEQSVVVV